MYAVIKTGGKQYRVQAGDLLVVEKLEGEPGAEVAFGDVLMLGDGDAVTLGAPLVDGATVSATLIETRKGEKVKIFKKIRRQGYRRTRGHRQTESVLRVTSIAGAGKTDKWDGTVDLTSKALLDARARNLKNVVAELEAAAPAAAPAKKAAAPKKAAKAAEAPAVAEAAAEVQGAAPAKKAAPKKAPAKKSDDAAE
jgi:large subunit ribosomal protein L21